MDQINPLSLLCIRDVPYPYFEWIHYMQERKLRIQRADKLERIRFEQATRIMDIINRHDYPQDKIEKIQKEIIAPESLETVEFVPKKNSKKLSRQG